MKLVADKAKSSGIGGQERIVEEKKKVATATVVKKRKRKGKRFPLNTKDKDGE